jgi:UDP-2,3-diacylglucosamine hydrolase
MRALALSAAHITGDPEDPSQAALVALLGRVELDALYLLGDLFHAGWAWPGGLRPGYAPTLHALDRLISRGVRVVFVPGNHDFGVVPALLAQGVQVETSLRLEVGGRRLLLAHGDEADRSLGYRVLSAALRGPAFGALMQVLGPTRGDALLDRLAGASRGHPAVPARLIAAQAAWAQRQIDDGVDLVGLGHSHHIERRALRGGHLVCLGDWVGQRCELWIEGASLRLQGPWGSLSL